MPTVFISYRHVQPDADLAAQLASALTRERHHVFIDTLIPLGRLWGEVVESELAKADFLIAVISKESAVSPMVVTELAEAHRLNLERGRPRILPLRLGGEFQLRYPLSAYVSRFQHAQWLGPRQTEAVISQVTSAVRDLPPARSRVASQRLELIRRVQNDWIKGVLETSLYRVARLELGLKLDHTRVSRGLDAIIQRPLEAAQLLSPDTALVQVFDDQQGQLLILGQPGGGKTTMLLELARDLLERAEQDEVYPIPVVFNLSSWAVHRKPLSEWLIDELHLRSDAPQKLAREWVANDQILPLLDGLDEVVRRHRPACVEAINAYRRTHGWVPIVVCSRTAEYEALSNALALPGAVVVQPLTRNEIERYLMAVDDSLHRITITLQSSSHLCEMLQVPLMVSVFALAFQNATNLPSMMDEDQLLERYVEAMFHRRAPERRYAERDMRRWIGWLASQQVDHAQSIFFLEDIVPEWLSMPRAAFVADLLLIAMATMLSSMWFYILLVAQTSSVMQSVPLDLFLWTVLSAPVAILLATAYGRRSGPVEALRLSFPGWSVFIGETILGVVLGYIMGGALGYAYEVSTNLSSHIARYIAASFGAATIGITFALRSFLGARMVGLPSAPGALVKRSARSSALTLVFTSVLSVLVSRILLKSLSVIAFGDTLPVLLLYLMLASVAVGVALLGWSSVFLALERGGYFLIRHYIARLVVLLTHRGPWRYTRFLEVATDRLLLRKVGGGYIFVHRVLMEHLARTYSRTGSVTKADYHEPRA